MKTKLIIIVLSLVAVVSFTALTTKSKIKHDREAQSYQSSGGQTMSDPNQFD